MAMIQKLCGAVCMTLPSVDIQVKEVSNSHCTTESLIDSCKSVEHAYYTGVSRCRKLLVHSLAHDPFLITSP